VAELTRIIMKDTDEQSLDELWREITGEDGDDGRASCSSASSSPTATATSSSARAFGSHYTVGDGFLVER
jgi:hypothetical protein